MDDLRPQDVHFAWEDIMAYKASAGPKTSRRHPHLSISGYPPFRQEKVPRDDIYDSDGEATSQWSESETGSSVSTGLFSIADSHTTHASSPLNGLECCFRDDDDDELEFPSYHDAPPRPHSRMSELCNPFQQLVLPVSGRPKAMQHAEDDSAVQDQPSRHVDYLSHDWCEEDVSATWRYLRSTRTVYSNSQRLQNAAWRMWVKARYNLGTTEPQRINWMKDRDVTWLYGPLQTGGQLDGQSSPKPAESESMSPSVKPILKKPTLSETLLRRSLSVSSLKRVSSTNSIQTHRSSDYRNESSALLLPVPTRPKPTVRFSFDSTSDWSHRSPAPTKNVRFDDELEQHSDFGPIDLDEGDIDVSPILNDRQANATELRRALIAGGISSATAPTPMAPIGHQDGDDGGLETDSDSSSESECESADWEGDVYAHSEEEDYFGPMTNLKSRTELSIMESTLDPVRNELVEIVMNEFWTLFNQESDSSFTECASNSPGSSSSSGSSRNANTTSRPAIQLQRKRQRVDDSDNPDNNDDRNRQPRQPHQPSTLRAEVEKGPKFACPFRKCDANTYNIYNSRVCALSHWKTIARVKEHIYRCHQGAPHCKRCWQTFKNQQQLDSHLTVDASEICEVRPGNPPGGITPEMERRLRSRKKAHPEQTDEDRWKEIFMLLFPNTEVPSPYFEIVQDEPPSSPDSRELANYEGFLRRELPRLVRSNIEEVVRRETQPLEAALIGNLVGIIQDCQDRVFRAYRETQGLDEDVCIPSITTLASATLPEAICSEETDARGESDFLEAAFQAPVPTREQRGPDFQHLGLSSYKVFSDSGYSSEPVCNCRSLCSCTRSTPNVPMPDNAFPTTQEISHPWAPPPTGDPLSNPSWQHAELTEDEADWWMNI